MDEMKLSPDRVEVLKKITEYEREGRFDEDVENDPPAPELLPDQVDYLCKKLSSKVSRKIANFVADHFFLRLIKKKELVIDGVTGEEYLTALKNGAIVTCNHFHPYDNYAVFHCIRKALPRKYLYKVIREGNYTNFPGLYGRKMDLFLAMPMPARPLSVLPTAGVQSLPFIYCPRLRAKASVESCMKCCTKSSPPRGIGSPTPSSPPKTKHPWSFTGRWVTPKLPSFPAVVTSLDRSWGSLGWRKPWFPSIRLGKNRFHSRFLSKTPETFL